MAVIRAGGCALLVARETGGSACRRQCGSGRHRSDPPSPPRPYAAGGGARPRAARPPPRARAPLFKDTGVAPRKQDMGLAVFRVDPERVHQDWDCFVDGSRVLSLRLIGGLRSAAPISARRLAGLGAPATCAAIRSWNSKISLIAPSYWSDHICVCMTASTSCTEIFSRRRHAAPCLRPCRQHPTRVQRLSHPQTAP